MTEIKNIDLKYLGIRTKKNIFRNLSTEKLIENIIINKEGVIESIKQLKRPSAALRRPLLVVAATLQRNERPHWTTLQRNKRPHLTTLQRNTCNL